MEPNRKGTVTEYKKGHHYLTETKWEDGHTEIEVHRCVPDLLWHSCDSKQLTEAMEIFEKLEHQHPTEYKKVDDSKLPPPPPDRQIKEGAEPPIPPKPQA